MTPAARVAAAIEILDRVGDGQPAEQVLTRWGRSNRFAGSKDRAALRDHVFDVLRQRRTAAWWGGAQSGRGLMIGLLRLQGVDPAQVFTGEGHAPAPLLAHEAEGPPGEMPASAAWNLPDWLMSHFEAGLGPQGLPTAQALCARAPVTLRVNIAKTNASDALLMLNEAGIVAQANPLSPTALTVLEGARRIRTAPAYLEGHVELQDASSQAVVDLAPQAAMALDYCAGGGGKALALAARGMRVFAHDIDPGRMGDLPARAARAGVEITQLGPEMLGRQGPYDLVLVDAPCSGSGAWRRAPEAKWRFTPEDLVAVCATQDAILDAARALVAPGGTLVYATCSVLPDENGTRVAAFAARHSGWRCTLEKSFPVSDLGDGFYTAHLTQRL